MASTCPICGGPSQLMYEDLYDDRYGYPGHYELRSCDRCRHRHLVTSLSEADISDLYRTRYPRAEIDLSRMPKFPEASAPVAWLDGARSAAFRWVPPNVRVLDIGCGSCETLAYHLSRGCEAVGFEADDNVRRIAERWGFDVRIGLFDPAEFPEAHFDVITMDQVVEHVAEPVAFLRGVGRVLKPGGSIVVSTPNSRSFAARILGRRWMNWHAPYHLHHFSGRSLRLASEEAGLEVVGIRTLTNSDWLRLQLMHLVTRPTYGERSPLWDAGRSERKVGRALDWSSRAARRTRVLHPLARLADAAGMGDNWLARLRKPD